MEPSVSVRFAGDGEGDAPLVVPESVIRQFKYFTQVMDGEFQEGQERQVCIEKISRPIGEVVLQQELDIVDSLTKGNLLDALIALDYLQFDIDQIFTKGSNQSLLCASIARCVVVEGWLADHQLATCLLDSFARYPFIARFIHCHPDICAALRQSLRKKTDVIREQWRRRERGEVQDDSIKAAVSLVASLGDAMSYDAMDMSRHELAQFLTNATGSTSLSAAQAAVFESDEFSSSSTATVRPFADGRGGAITCMGFSVIVVGLPPPYSPCASSNLPANAIRGGDAKLTEVAGWHAHIQPVVTAVEGESAVSCYAPYGSLEVSGANGDSDATHPAAQLHDSRTLMDMYKIRMGEGAPAGVSSFGVKLVGAYTALYGNDRIISADALAQHGLGDIRLKDIQLTMTARRFPMRELALHYLRMCVIEGRYEEISMMARSIHRQVAEYMVTNMAFVQRHRLPSMLYWAAAIEGISLSQYRVETITSALGSYFDISDVPAVLPLIPLLPSAIQTAFKSALKKAVDAHDEEAFDQLYDHLIERETTRKKEAAERHPLEAEIQRLREEIASLKTRESGGADGQGDEGEAA
ncbi:unnamed protein product [Vitrella brassicaformis CCMP3155]|uniref:Uncharacterized protein n=1 Tax=Vitrella brassicaformis (strain CCMP3155) TaxID=1169540 RepID=A0A0G4EG32_VITBC|nr:unnamed protein product [Vitrella brassicaformis CCMP3155]|eukprot:CEL94341.1 unnamed protein product [Vitrella brassicaformis CCMP3155]